MYGLLVGFWMVIKTDNTAYQALVLVWLWCGKRLNNGNNNGQATHGARKHAWRTQAFSNLNGRQLSTGHPLSLEFAGYFNFVAQRFEKYLGQLLNNKNV